MSTTEVTHEFKLTDCLVKEEFECNELFTPEQTMARIFDTSVGFIPSVYL